MTSMDNPPGGGTEEDLEDGEIFDDDEPPQEVLSNKKTVLPSQNSFDSDSGGPKRHLSPNNFSPDMQKNIRDRKLFEGRPDKRNDRGGRSAPPPRRNKRSRDSEEELGKASKPKTRRASDSKKSGSAGEEEVDENEMIYVMGGNSPTSNNRNTEWENRFSDEETEIPSNRGRRGAGPRRPFEGARSLRRNRFTRGGKTRNSRLKNDHRNEFTLCKFFMAGNCQRGKDCPFSHDASPPKRMELCKFYMNDCCNKKDKCLYMHQEFPCKFFHSGLKCYAGKRCKYSHGKITNYLRQALHKHLETCDLREEHERMREMFERKERGFERYRFPERDDRRSSVSVEREEEGHTPMPSPQHNHFSDREGGSVSPGDRRDDGFVNESFRNDSHPSRARDNRRNVRGRKRRHDFDERNDEDGFYKDFGPPHLMIDQSAFGRDADFSVDEQQLLVDQNQGNFYKESEGKAAEDSETLPVNMPRTQRELYMRIQQQMKKSETKSREDPAKEDDFREENWYSSDEEGGTSGSLVNNPLNTIFSNVPGLQKNAEDTAQEDGSHKPNATMFPDIDVNAVTKLLSTLRETIQKKKDEESIQQKKEEEITPMEKRNSQAPAAINSPDEKRGSRDPRIRGTSGQMVLTAADFDLRGSPPRPSTEPSTSPMDVDLRSLPFKPAPVHESANEIDASVSSGPPIEWSLKVLPPIGPDYKLIASRLSTQTCLNDPRLKSHIQPQALEQSQQSMIGTSGLLNLPLAPLLMPGPTTGPPVGPIPPGMVMGPGGFVPIGPGGPMTMGAGPLGPGVPMGMALGPMVPVPGPTNPIPPGPLAPGGPMSIRDPRQRHSGDSKPSLINDPRRKSKAPEIEDNDLRIGQMGFPRGADTDFRVPAVHSQQFFK